MCDLDEYTVFSGVDTVSCEPCPVGGDCTGRVVEGELEAVQGRGNRVVQLQNAVALPGCVRTSTPTPSLTSLCCLLCMVGVV